MEIYEIFKTHNRPWSGREIFCFGVLFLLTAGAVLYLRKEKKLKTLQAAAICGMVGYMGIVFASTVFTRPLLDERIYELELFWSWKKVFLEHSLAALQGIILNILLLAPAGMLLPLMADRKVKGRYGLALGFLISLAIELCQLIFYRGLFELDDIIHNGLGAMAGCMMMNRIMDRIRKRKHGNL
ncbi:MAG: VanZ family protein [Ruminococcus sp.]|jgi:glycopeptide antibiotics resistance protein